MKKVFVVFALLGFFCTTTAIADVTPTDDDVRITVKPLEGKAFSLHVANLQQQSAKIEISDLDGNVYFEAYVNKHNGYARKIDLNQLENGKYVLRVKQNGINYSRVMVVKDQSILFSQVNQH